MKPQRRKQNSRASAPAPSPAGMDSLLRSCGLRLTSAQLEKLWAYHQALRENNPEMNLTRIHGFDNMVLKLYADSLLPGKLIKLPSPLLDLGTGPGMPGIPLAIAHPKVELLLAEPRGNRVRFLEETVRRLGLANARVKGQSINERFTEPVAGVITRAVSTMAETLKRVDGCLLKDGLMVFMKGPNCDDEIAEVQRLFNKQYALVKDLPYRLGDTPNDRRLVVFRRLSEPSRAIREKAMKRHTVHFIESEQNDIFRDFRKALAAKGLRKLGFTCLSGAKQVAEALRDFPELALGWISKGDGTPPPADAPAQLRWYQLAPALFEALDLFGTGHPLLSLKIPAIPAWLPDDGFPPGCTVLVPFQDPENVGAVIRSAVAFGATQVILLAEAAHPFHPKALRASSGAVLRARLLTGPSINDLPPGLPLVGLSGEGRDIASFRFPESCGLLPGLEGQGLPKAFRGTAIAIPIETGVESLNAATATAIALHAWRSRTAG